MKEELLKLYTNWTPIFKETESKIQSSNLNGPFLMSPGSSYCDQKIRLLVIGKESFGWYKEIDNPEIQMKNYENFILSSDSKGSPFWNIISKIKTLLGNQRFSCLTTNINKFDVDKKSPKGKNLEIISGIDSMLIDEIRISKPNVCIFFTGPSLDFRIDSIFSGIEFIEIPGFKVRQLCQLKHQALPKHTFRSYHPNYLRLSKREPRFIEAIEQLLTHD